MVVVVVFNYHCPRHVGATPYARATPRPALSPSINALLKQYRNPGNPDCGITRKPMSTVTIKKLATIQTKYDSITQL